MSDRLLCVVAPKCKWNSQNTKTPKKGTTPVSLCNGAILHFSLSSQKGENQLEDQIVPVSSLSTVVTPSHVGQTTNDIKESNLWKNKKPSEVINHINTTNMYHYREILQASINLAQ